MTMCGESGVQRSSLPLPCLHSTPGAGLLCTDLGSKIQSGPSEPVSPHLGQQRAECLEQSCLHVPAEPGPRGCESEGRVMLTTEGRRASAEVRRITKPNALAASSFCSGLPVRTPSAALEGWSVTPDKRIAPESQTARFWAQMSPPPKPGAPVSHPLFNSMSGRVRRQGLWAERVLAGEREQSPCSPVTHLRWSDLHS